MTVRQDLRIQQGATFSKVLPYSDSAGGSVDLSSGYTARMAIKAGFEDGNEAYLTDGADSVGGQLTLNSDSTIEIAMTALESNAQGGDLTYFLFTAPEERAGREICFIYDLELVASDGTVERVFEGRIIIDRGVTN